NGLWWSMQSEEALFLLVECVNAARRFLQFADHLSDVIKMIAMGSGAKRKAMGGQRATVRSRPTGDREGRNGARSLSTHLRERTPRRNGCRGEEDADARSAATARDSCGARHLGNALSCNSIYSRGCWSLHQDVGEAS